MSRVTREVAIYACLPCQKDRRATLVIVRESLMSVTPCEKQLLSQRYSASRADGRQPADLNNRLAEHSMSSKRDKMLIATLIFTVYSLQPKTADKFWSVKIQRSHLTKTFAFLRRLGNAFWRSHSRFQSTFQLQSLD